MFKSKYKNKRVVNEYGKFDSIKEFNRYRDLAILERAGEIFFLQRQVAFVLAPPVVLDGRKKPALKYVADFVYKDKLFKVTIEDCKSEVTKKDRVYRIKKHLMKALLGLDIFET